MDEESAPAAVPHAVRRQARQSCDAMGSCHRSSRSSLKNRDQRRGGCEGQCNGEYGVVGDKRAVEREGSSQAVHAIQDRYRLGMPGFCGGKDLFQPECSPGWR